MLPTVSSVSTCLNTILTGVTTVAVMYYGGLDVRAQRVSIGEVMLFFSVLEFALNGAAHIVPSIASLQEARVSVDRLRDVTSEPLE